MSQARNELLEQLNPELRSILEQQNVVLSTGDLEALTKVSVKDIINFFEDIKKGVNKKEAIENLTKSAVGKLKEGKLTRFSEGAEGELEAFKRQRENEVERHQRENLMRQHSIRTLRRKDIRSKKVINKVAGAAFSSDEWIELAGELEADEKEIDACIAFAFAVSLAKDAADINPAFTNLFNIFNSLDSDHNSDALLKILDVYISYPETEVAGLICRGLYQQLRLNDNENAAQDLKRLTEIGASTKAAKAVGYCLLGRMYDYQANQNEALHNFKKAAQLFPDFCWTYSGRAGVLVKQEKLQDALQDYNKAVALFPKFFGGFNDRGVLKVQMGKHEEALEDFNQAIEAYPDAYAPYNNRGQLYHDVFNKPQKALEDYIRAAELEPYSYEVYMNRGSLYRNKLNKPHEALRDFNIAVGLLPQSESAYISRANTQATIGKYEEAMNDYNKALELNPNNFLSYLNRASLHADMNKYHEALDDFEKSIRLNPNHVNTYMLRGHLYEAKLKNVAKAQEDFRKAENIMATI